MNSIPLSFNLLRISDLARLKSGLKTVTKKGITVNPKKEDLMKEALRNSVKASIDSLKEAAKKNSQRQNQR